MSLSNQQKVITFDLDDVLCSRPDIYEHRPIAKYHYCTPNQEMVDIVNALFQKGYIIKIFTARGMGTFEGNPHKIYNALFTLTETQLKTWKVNYHELIMGKPHYDLFIDDKGMNSKDIKSVNDVINQLV